RLLRVPHVAALDQNRGPPGQIQPGQVGPRGETVRAQVARDGEVRVLQRVTHRAGQPDRRLYLRGVQRRRGVRDVESARGGVRVAVGVNGHHRVRPVLVADRRAAVHTRPDTV